MKKNKELALEEVKDLVRRIDVLVHDKGFDYGTAMYIVCPSRAHRVAVGKVLGSRPKKKRSVKKDTMSMIVQLEFKFDTKEKVNG